MCFKKWSLVLCILVLALLCVACDGDEHTHSFSMWQTTTAPSCVSQGTQTRTCSSCGFSEYSTIPATGHTEVESSAVPATCTQDGKTTGKHCSACNTIFVAQNVIPATGHTEVDDPAVPATCTQEGKAAGKHCSVCNAVLVAQAPTDPLGHTYNEGEIITEATCIAEGTKKYTCTALDCGDSYTESYALPSFTATEIYNQSVQYVGEITTYNKRGEELALGTGFLISADGQIVTNYHVINDAYSAKITIDGTTYQIKSVLAYSESIDLAVLKIDASNLPYATVCKTTPEVGKTIYAIGSSRGMTNTYTQGIITYADRVVDDVSYVQHDASITNGNSGGPLINEYGEVIGINAWLISNSQNLNFAIFADELDNLTFGTPLTMAEFYEKECNVFVKMKNYIIENGTYSNDYYRLTLGTEYSSDYTDKYTRIAYYYPETDKITLDFLIDDGDSWAYFVITDDISGEYRWNYFDDYDSEMSGILYASTYTSNSLLGYDDYENLSSSSLRQSVRELASLMIDRLISYISTDFSAIGVTADDLGFLNY